jgi:hypothetical protein
MVFTFETTEDSIDHFAAEVLERNEKLEIHQKFILVSVK